MVSITADIQIPDSEFQLSYARSSGPGGQNVNKVNSKAVLRWNLLQTASLSVVMKARLSYRLKNQLTCDGELVISSDRFRDQIRNREDCFEKFRCLILEASATPKTRKKTKPSHSSVRKAKNIKSKHSEKKSRRKNSHFDD